MLRTSFACGSAVLGHSYSDAAPKGACGEAKCWQGEDGGRQEQASVPALEVPSWHGLHRAILLAQECACTCTRARARAHTQSLSDSEKYSPIKMRPPLGCRSPYHPFSLPVAGLVVVL